MTKKQLLGSVLILVVLCFICKFIYDEFKVDEGEIKTKLVVTKTDSNDVRFDLYFSKKDTNYYIYNLDKIVVDYGDRKLELNKALEARQITMDFVLNYVKENGETNLYKDGGTIKYSNKDLAIIKCQTIDGNKDYYFGPSDMEYNEGFCKEEPYVCSFTKTYMILDISDSNDLNYSYLTLRGFQEEDVVTVKVDRTFTLDMIEETYYEFMFASYGKSMDEDIKSIFDNHKLLSVVLSDKVGLDQINEKVCR